MFNQIAFLNADNNLDIFSPNLPNLLFFQKNKIFFSFFWIWLLKETVNFVSFSQIIYKTCIEKNILLVHDSVI